MEIPEDSPVPLAWDSAGEPFDPPRGAMYWRVRRVLPRGGLQVVKVGASRPLLLKLTSTEDDAIAALVELRQPNGRYRLDPVDSLGRTCGAVHTVLDYQRPLGTDEDGSASDDVGAAVGSAITGDIDKAVIGNLLGTIRDLAQSNALTAARIGEALATNANHSGDKLGGFVEGFARLVNLANQSAVAREVVVHQPGLEPQRAGGVESGLNGIVPHLGPVIAAKAGDVVDALINRLRQPSSPTAWAQQRNGLAPLPPLPLPPQLPLDHLRGTEATEFASSTSNVGECSPPGSAS